jgi:hypothetical protein
MLAGERGAASNTKSHQQQATAAHLMTFRGLETDTGDANSLERRLYYKAYVGRPILIDNRR